MFHLDISGISNKDSHPEKIPKFIGESDKYFKFLVFHIDIFGNYLIFLQLENNPHIFIIFSVFQFDISGISNTDSHPENKKLILITYLIFQCDILGNIFIFLQFLNILFIFIILPVFHLDIFGNSIKDLHPENKELI